MENLNLVQAINYNRLGFCQTYQTKKLDKIFGLNKLPKILTGVNHNKFYIIQNNPEFAFRTKTRFTLPSEIEKKLNLTLTDDMSLTSAIIVNTILNYTKKLGYFVAIDWNILQEKMSFFNSSNESVDLNINNAIKEGYLIKNNIIKPVAKSKIIPFGELTTKLKPFF